APQIAETERKQLADEALRVLDHPELKTLFGPGSRAEVDVLAHLRDGGPAEIAGRIDRIAVTEREVILADFKTGTPPAAGAEAPGNYVRQLAVYRRALAGIYPNRAMRCMLVWTESGTIQEIAAEGLDAASRAVFDAT